ncbi:hypothetical protein N8I77_010482 [Diaporthe amygdali]|uniref:Uncharacterized protein n=1 Tax=Phomopsis amygdali TaxID=1214568 RepID=A0AAD9S7E7_PHOAM|nr:hypothetical protein N8I77_010482 [Diaporthe amygdali]
MRHVAGFGVLISFGVSILVMVAAIIYGYWSRSLRSDRYNGLDDFILDTLRSPRGRDEEYTRRRVAALEKFILGLGDQQLVSGISITLAIYLIRFGVAGLDQKVSGYSYCIAVHLALLSCVVHLSSLTILRDHFDAHKHLRNIRICLILPAVGMLLPQLVLAQAVDSTVTLTCGLDSLVSITENESNFYQTIAILIIISGGFIRRIFEVYFPLCRKAPDVWIAKVCSKYIGYPKQWDLESYMDRSYKKRIGRAVRLVNVSGGGVPVLLIADVLMRELGLSFFAEIAWLLFYTTYSLCSLAWLFIWGGDGTIDQSPVTFTPSFGQILPLVLLIATGLAITETFAEPLEGRSREDTDNSSFGAVLIQIRNSIAKNLDEFRICQDFYALKAIIWILIACEILVLLFGAVVLAGFMNIAGPHNEALGWAGWFWSYFFFIYFYSGLVRSLVANLFWVRQKTFRSPVDLRWIQAQSMG